MAAAMAAFGSQCHPRKRPTVGAGSSQRDDSPARFSIREDPPRRLRRANPPHPSNQPYAHTMPPSPLSPNIPISDGLSRLESLKIGIPSAWLFLQDNYAID